MALLSQPAGPSYAFLKDSEVTFADEYIGPGTAHIVMYVQRKNITVPQPYASLRPKAEAELTSLGFKVVERKADSVWISNITAGKILVLAADGDVTTIHLSEMRMPTILDRTRLWMKSMFSSRSESSTESGETK